MLTKGKCKEEEMQKPVKMPELKQRLLEWREKEKPRRPQSKEREKMPRQRLTI